MKMLGCVRLRENLLSVRTDQFFQGIQKLTLAREMVEPHSIMPDPYGDDSKDENEQENQNDFWPIARAGLRLEALLSG